MMTQKIEWKECAKVIGFESLFQWTILKLWKLVEALDKMWSICSLTTATTTITTTTTSTFDLSKRRRRHFRHFSAGFEKTFRLKTNSAHERKEPR